jgi:hypothetical protein
MLTRAFAAEMVEQIRVPEVRSAVDALVAAALARRG